MTMSGFWFTSLAPPPTPHGEGILPQVKYPVCKGRQGLEQDKADCNAAVDERVGEADVAEAPCLHLNLVDCLPLKLIVALSFSATPGFLVAHAEKRRSWSGRAPLTHRTPIGGLEPVKAMETVKANATRQVRLTPA